MMRTFLCTKCGSELEFQEKVDGIYTHDINDDGTIIFDPDSFSGEERFHFYCETCDWIYDPKDFGFDGCDRFRNEPSQSTKY